MVVVQILLICFARFDSPGRTRKIILKDRFHGGTAVRIAALVCVFIFKPGSQPGREFIEFPGQCTTRGRQSHQSKGELNKSPRRHQKPFVQLPSYKPFLDKGDPQTRQRCLDAKMCMGKLKLSSSSNSGARLLLPVRPCTRCEIVHDSCPRCCQVPVSGCAYRPERDRCQQNRTGTVRLRIRSEIPRNDKIGAFGPYLFS